MSKNEPMDGVNPDGLRNFWYPVVPSAELSEGAVAIRRLNEPLVAWRDAAGTAHLFTDRCPHRSAPLSMGTVQGGRLRCGYHGLEFDETGACRKVPYERMDDGPLCTPYQVRSYACEERAGYLWAFMADDLHSGPVPPLVLETEMASDDYEWFLTSVEFGADWLTVMENQADPGHAPALHGDAPFFPPPEDVLDWFIPVDLPFVAEQIPTPSGEGTRPSIALVAPTVYQGGEMARFLPPTLIKIPVQLPFSPEITWVLQYHTPVDEHSTIGYWCTTRKVNSEEEREQWRQQQEMFAAVWKPVDDQDVRICEVLKVQDRSEVRLLPQDGGITRVKRLLLQLQRGENVSADEASEDRAAANA